MKIRILLFLCTLILCCVHSQSNTIVVKYTEVVSLGAPNVNLTSYNSGLYINSKYALYVSKIDSLENGGKKIQKTYQDNDGKIHGIRSFSSPIGLYQITDRSEGIVYSNARFSNRFKYKEETPQMKWKIGKETKKLNELTVQKATTTFRGRNYVAWFSPDIPVSLGPWKLNGLPGLILEAYDTNNELYFLFKKLEYPYKKKINFPTLEGDWATYKEFTDKKKAHLERNLKYSRAIGQQFDAQASTEETEKLKNKNFIEVTN